MVAPLAWGNPACLKPGQRSSLANGPCSSFTSSTRSRAPPRSPRGCTITWPRGLTENRDPPSGRGHRERRRLRHSKNRCWRWGRPRCRRVGEHHQAWGCGGKDGGESRSWQRIARTETNPGAGSASARPGEPQICQRKVQHFRGKVASRPEKRLPRLGRIPAHTRPPQGQGRRSFASCWFRRKRGSDHPAAAYA